MATLRSFTRKRKWRKNSFRPDSKTIAEAMRKFEKNGGTVTVLPSSPSMSADVPFNAFDELLGSENSRGVYD